MERRDPDVPEDDRRRAASRAIIQPGIVRKALYMNILASATRRAAPAFALVAALAVAADGRQGPAAPPPDQLAARIQTHYEAVRDFTANFTQTYRGGVLRKTTTERGTVAIKKPGRMKWTYTQPEEKLFVSDGTRMYIHVPADRQVIVRQMPSADTPASPVLSLLGRGNLTRDFAASATTVPGAPAGTWALRLTPRQRQPEYDWLSLVVDPASLAIRMLVAQDGQGGTSTFAFTNLQENVGLSDKTFSFRIPRGADVITEG
jgi:outer membrane lipoprotein carrier protein